MKIHRILCLILLPALLLAGCKKGSDSTDTSAPTEAMTPAPDEVQSPAAGLTLVENGKTEYVIVVDVTDSHANTFAGFLREAVMKRTGAMIPLRAADSAESYQKRIYIGREDIKDSHQSFTVKAEADTLVFSASDPEGYISMESYLTATMLADVQNKTWTVSDTLSYTHDASAASETLQLQKSVQYKLVYPADDADAGKAAAAYAAYLTSDVGMKVQAAPDSSAYENEILLGNVNRPAVKSLLRYMKGEDIYFWGVKDGAYIIYAQNRLQLAMGIEDIASQMLSFSSCDLTAVDNRMGTAADFPQNRFFKDSVRLAKQVYGTYSSLMEREIDLKMSAADKEDIKLVDALITRMGKSVAVRVGSSSALYNGFVVKLDSIDYSMVTKRRDDGHILVATDFLETYFGKTLSADADGYLDLTALVGETAGLTLSYDAATQIAVITPTRVKPFSDPALSSGGYTNAQYLERMKRFFDNPMLPEPDVAVEGTRTEIIANEYDPAYIYDYTDMTYECYASPEILHMTVGGVSTLFISYDIMQMEFPNGVNTTMSGDTRFAKSTDGGKTWQEIATVRDLTYVAIVELNGKLLLLGNRVSNGYVWVGIYDPATGDLQAKDLGFSVWGSAPTAVAIANGRIYRAHNYAVISAPVDADLLNADSWTRTAPPSELITEADYERITGTNVTGKYMLEEGNVVVGPDGELYVLYRIDASPTYGYAAILHLSADGKTLTPVESDKCVGRGIIRIPSNQSKFQIRYDEATGLYLSMVSITTVEEDSAHRRNVMALIASPDLFTWETVGVMLVEREMMNDRLSAISHAYQYVSFDFVGDDLVMVVREAVGNACNYHNSNAITMYTLTDYAEYIRTHTPGN